MFSLLCSIELSSDLHFIPPEHQPLARLPEYHRRTGNRDVGGVYVVGFHSPLGLGSVFGCPFTPRHLM